MKRIRAEDAWRRATTKDRSFRATRLRVIGKPPLADLDEQLGNGVLILCGLNGTAKTTLLRLVEAAVRGREAVQGRCREEILSDGTFILTLECNETTVDLAIADEPDSAAPQLLLLDSFGLCGRLLEIGNQTNFEDLLEGVEAREYTADEVEEASYVVGKHYEGIRVWEIETPDEEDVVLPVFEAVAGGTRYDFRAMGLGELAALAALWHLDRLDEGTIVLVEEPETFLSASSTVALLDVVAERVHGKRLYAIATSHSLEIIARAPVDSIRLMTSTAGGVVLRRLASRAELEFMLGAYVGQARVVFVEDGVARLVVSELLGRYGGFWGDSVAIVVAGDAQAVRTLCKQLPVTDAIRAAGILDGDQAVDDDAQRNWPLLALPGGEAPDEVLRTATLANRELFADRTGRSLDLTNAAFETVAGRDVHDWFPELARALQLELGSVVRSSLDCWLAIEENRLQAKEFVKGVTSALVN
jgi:hypothetical protein